MTRCSSSKGLILSVLALSLVRSTEMTMSADRPCAEGGERSNVGVVVMVRWS